MLHSRSLWTLAMAVALLVPVACSDATHRSTPPTVGNGAVGSPSTTSSLREHPNGSCYENILGPLGKPRELQNARRGDEAKSPYGSASVIQASVTAPYCIRRDVTVHLYDKPAPGDLLLAEVQIDSGLSVATPKDWHALESMQFPVATGAVALFSFWRFVTDDDDGAYTFEAQGQHGFMSASVREIVGARSPNPFDGFRIVPTFRGQMTPASTASLKPTIKGDLPVATLPAVPPSPRRVGPRPRPSASSTGVTDSVLEDRR